MEGTTTRSLRELTQVLFSRLVGILVILVVVVVAVVAVTMMSRWSYRSRALLRARPLLLQEGGASLRDRLSLFVVTQRELIMSDPVIASALMRMETADRQPTVLGGQATTRPSGGQWYRDEQISEFSAAYAGELAAARGRIKVETPGGVDVTFTQMFTVIVDWPEERELAGRRNEDPREFACARAQEFANHLLVAYQARRAKEGAESAAAAAEFLSRSVSDISGKNLTDARKALAEFIVQELKGDVVLAENLLQGIGEVGAASVSTESLKEIIVFKARLKELQALDDSIATEFRKGVNAKVTVPGELLRSNPSLTAMLSGIATQRLKLNGLRQKYTDAYEEVRQLKSEMTQNITDLKDEVEGMIRQERAALTARLNETVTQMDLQKKHVQELAAMIPQLKQLQSEMENAQKIYDKVQVDTAAAQNAQALAATSVEVRVFSRPSRPAPDRPHRPVLWLNILVGVVSGLVLSMIYAFAADHLDHSVKGMDDVHRHVEGVNVLASIPKFRRSVIRAK